MMDFLAVVGIPFLIGFVAALIISALEAWAEHRYYY